MPVPLTYPGVYIEELPSGVHTITGVATSITAFIGRAARGPVNQQTVINSFADYERQFGGLWMLSTMSYAVRDFYLNGGSQAIIVRLVHGGLVAKVAVAQDSSPPASPLDSPLSSPFGSLWLQAANEGQWGNSLSITTDQQTKAPNDVLLFNLGVVLTDSNNKIVAQEKFLNVSVDPQNSRYVATVLDQNSDLLRVMKDGTGKYQVPGSRPQAVQNAALKGGDDGGALQDTDVATGAGLQAAKQGLYALENADLFNLLCIPPYNGPDLSPGVIAAAAAYCEPPHRAFFLVDSPSTWTDKGKAVNGFKSTGVGTVSDHAAVFFPRLLEADPLQDNNVGTFVPCGAVAGIFARTDAQRGVWKAPAGQDASVVGIADLSVRLTDSENGELNPLGVNCIRQFPIIGPVLWGSRTLQGADQLASQWKYIPVRRTALYIEESLYRGTKWVVFEPNDEPLWAQIRLNVGAFMHDLFRQGAFQGKTPREAYLVKCDSETTTQNDIDRGVVNILVGFAPLKPAEFVVIQIEQLAGQIQV
jgi:phage tail sheath protein FI